MYLHASFMFAWFDFVHWDKGISVVPNLQWPQSSYTRGKNQMLSLILIYGKWPRILKQRFFQDLFWKGSKPNTYMFLALQVSRKKAKCSLILSLTRLTHSLCKSLQDWDWGPEELRYCEHAPEMSARHLFPSFFWFNGSLLLPHWCHESLHSAIQI